ncbi:cation:proton antiporter [Paraliomyxa miuraensis]|uniref:cation:proton antiporter n=1 Tax=Paraliomyxa miuraensis TaxID=376150 RepID=UPI00224E77BC|nr:cation:proton antiporter [Paraliomyxa miuraensis]MCX4239784.1 cation:proton antiporter [Paraliomyxa miuraensis]
MPHASLVTDLALVLGVAAVTGTVFRALRQPPILGYLLAGLIVGPYIPIPLFADVHRVHELSESGVVLVMFAVGLEFSLGRVATVLPLAGVTAAIQIGGMFWAGNVLGAALGLPPVGGVFLGASVAISSTMVVTKVFELHRPPADVRSMVLGVLVLQDLVAVVLIAVVTAVAEGSGLAPSALASTLGRLLGVLAAATGLGLWVVPRLARRIARLQSAEVSTVFALGLCFSLAAVMEHLGYSPALGAFLAGMLVAESGLGPRFEHLVAPLRDAFAAVFFVSVGMTVDPLAAVDHVGTAVIVAVAVVVLQLLLVTGAGLLSGLGLRRAGHAGLALGQIGEFGFIIMGIGVTAGVVPSHMFAVVVAAAVLTAFSTPLALRVAPRLLATADRRLPARLRANLSLYSAWVDALRQGDGVSEPRRLVRRTLTVLVLDAMAVAGLVIAASLGLRPATAFLGERAGLDPTIATAAFVAVLAIVVFPFARGLLRAARRLGGQFGQAVFPDAPKGRADLTTTSRRAMSIGLQLAALLATGLFVAALTQPFVPPGVGLLVLGAALLPSALSLWRSGGPLGEHVHSATLALVQFLRRDDLESQEPELHDLLHGLGDATAIRLGPGAAAAGRTLAQLDLRAVTGATVLAIAHPDSDVTAPTGREVLREGDVLAVAGPHEAVELARALLLRGAPMEDDAPPSA